MVHLKRQIALLKGRLKRFENIERREKHKSKRHHSAPMARKSRTRTIYRTARPAFHKRGGMRGMLGGAKGIFHKGALGIGGGVIAEEVAGRVMPQAAPIAGYAGAWFAGGTTGLIIKVVYDAITGKGGLLSGFLGGGQAQTSDMYL